MSRRYLRIMELMERPQGCTTDDISRDLGVTKDRARGMVKWLKDTAPRDWFSVERKLLGRGRGCPHVHRLNYGVKFLTADVHTVRRSTQ